MLAEEAIDRLDVLERDRVARVGEALEAQQAAGQLLAFSAKQQMQIQQLMAAQYRAEAQEAARKAQAEEAARIATQKFLGDSDAYEGE